MRTVLPAAACLPLLLGGCASIPQPPAGGPLNDATVTVSGESVYLHNPRISRSFVLRAGAPRTVGVTNRLAGSGELRQEGRDLRPFPEFALTLGDGRRLTDADFDAAAWSHDVPPAGPTTLRSTFRRPADGLAVDVVYEIPSGKSWIRKRLAVTVAGPSPVRIDRIELERFKPARPAKGHEGPGQPVYIDDLFWGCEYPAADNAVREGEVSLGYPCGLELRDGTLASRGAVVGAGFGGRVRDAFFDYVEDIRAVRRRPAFLYNSRYDLRAFDEEQALASLRDFTGKLTREYGVPLRCFLLDEGWEAPGSLWTPDPARLSRGFASLRPALQKAGTSLGLRISPSGGAGDAFEARKAWGAAQGFEPAGPGPGGFCLAAPTYRRRFLEAVLGLLREEGVNTLAFDSLPAVCGDSGHGHRAGPYAAAAMTDAFLEALAEIRRARPDVLLLLAPGDWLSPWWLLGADAVRCGGGEVGFAAHPEKGPRRERWITHVDETLHRELRLRERQVPLSALTAGGLVHGRHGGAGPDAAGAVGDRGEHADAWEREAAMFFGRGTMTRELAISPLITTRDQWTALSAWARWAAERDETLARGWPAGGDPAKGEPYAYVHAHRDRIIVAARNPSNVPKALALKADHATMRIRPGHAADWGVTYPRPEDPPPPVPKPRTGTLREGETWTLDLAPFEVRVVEMRAREGR